MLVKINNGIKLDPHQLEGDILDFYVARALNYDAFISHQMKSCLVKTKQLKQWTRFNPSTLWSHGGPLISTKRISIEYQGMIDATQYWGASYPYKVMSNNQVVISGPHPLIAAMRCIVYDYFGELIDPEVEPTLEEIA